MIERRCWRKQEIRALSNDDGVRRLAGYAAVFESRSHDLGGWYEVIAPGAFRDALGDDVRALWNHDPNFVLGRTTSGTLRIWEDENGLGYEVTLPNTSWARDLWELVARGDVRESSFAFTVADEAWDEGADGPVRTVKKIERLYDVSPVTYPAYPATQAEARAVLERARAEGRLPPPVAPRRPPEWRRKAITLKTKLLED